MLKKMTRNSSVRTARCCASDRAANARQPNTRPARAGFGVRRIHRPKFPSSSRRQQAILADRAILANSRAISPLRMTRTRSASESTVSGSVEKTTTAMPSAASERTICTTSSFAPTSMPRVGSTSTRTRGAWVSHLASATFCWLPPESEPSLASTCRAATPRRCVCTAAVARSAVGPEQPARDIFEKGDRDVAVDRLFANSIARRLSGDIADSRRLPAVVLARRTWRAVDLQRRRRRRRSLPNSVRASSIWPQPMKP